MTSYGPKGTPGESERAQYYTAGGAPKEGRDWLRGTSGESEGSPEFHGPGDTLGEGRAGRPGDHCDRHGHQRQHAHHERHGRQRHRHRQQAHHDRRAHPRHRCHDDHNDEDYQHGYFGWQHHGRISKANVIDIIIDMIIIRVMNVDNQYGQRGSTGTAITSS